MDNKTNSAARVQSEKNIVYVGIIVGLIVVFALITTAYVLSDMNARKTEMRLNDYYFESLNELSDEVDETVLNLSKLTLSLSKGTTAAELNDLSKHSAGAACALSRLPIDSDKTYSAMKLLNQINDFAASYTASLARGVDTESFTKSAHEFRKAAETLQQKVDEMMSRSMKKGEIVFENFSSGISVAGDDDQHETPDYPEMIYDGPFSDSRLPDSFKSLEDKEEISEQEALFRFESVLSESGAKVVGRSSSPEAYEIEGGSGAYAAISVKGGMFLEMSVPDMSGQGKNLSEDDVYRLAAEYSAKLGYGDVTPVWYYEGETVGYVNMAPEKDGAILYTDLVKVKLSLSDGSLLGLEATGYCRNHIDREIDPKISEATAAKLTGIEYDSVRLAVVPDGETEAVCYEVHGTHDGMEFYVYVDAVTGECVKALKVVSSGGGRLTA